ncbi:hypothetical protein R1sor_011907 [Riccia sorocarpa]|uniref:Uncharacterized protein n=1 Tax=Riccia sorocarpa TaxID=122646 RepID=A0ABD3I3K1_9MARC
MSRATSRSSSESDSAIAVTGFARYEYATRASVTQDSATSASATQEYVTSASADQKNEATSAPATQKDEPESAPATQNYVRQSASPTSSLNDSKTNVGGRATSTSSHGCDSRKGTDYFYSFQCCLFSSLVSKQKGRGRGRVGSTPAKQRTPARSGTSRRAAPKQPAPLSVNPNDGQDNEDDEMAELWRDFAVASAQTEAKKSERIVKEYHEHYQKMDKLRKQKEIEDWRAMDAIDRKKWDDIVATFLYGAINEYESRFGYCPESGHVPIPRTSPKPPGRPRLPHPPRETAKEEIERKKRAYELGIAERRPGTGPSCTHDLVWHDCPLCRRKPQPRLMQWSDEDLCAYYERIERQKKEEEEKERRRLVHKRKYFPVIYRNRVAKVIWYHEFYRRLEIELAV